MHDTLLYPPEPTFLEAIRRVSPHTSTLEEFFDTPLDSTEKTIERMERWHASAKVAPVRYSTTTFDAKGIESTMYVPHTPNTHWMSLDEALGTFGIKYGVLFSLPFFWQIEPLVFACCRANGLPIAPIAPNNIPIAVETIRQIGIEAMVGTKETITDIIAEFKRRNLHNPLRLYVCVCSPNEDVTATRTALRGTCSGTIMCEVHLFPGFPLLFQSLPLTQEDGTCFHLNENYVWQLGAQESIISGVTENALPVVRYPLKVALTPTDTRQATRPSFLFSHHGNAT